MYQYLTVFLSFFFLTVSFFYVLAEPFDPPQNVTIANVTASSVTLFWHPPAEPNGIIIHYTVYYSDNNTVAEQVGLVQCAEHSLSDEREMQITSMAFCSVFY